MPSDGESIFLTQSKFKDASASAVNTDEKAPKPNFYVQINIFSNISDEELINSSQDVESMSRFLKPLNQQDLDALVRSG
jgi:hypothetical protein